VTINLLVVVMVFSYDPDALVSTHCLSALAYGPTCSSMCDVTKCANTTACGPRGECVGAAMQAGPAWSSSLMFTLPPTPVPSTVVMVGGTTANLITNPGAEIYVSPWAPPSAGNCATQTTYVGWNTDGIVQVRAIFLMC
jgi:hypothetical protein